MLRSLHIRNYVLIDSLDVTFPEGLVIITGQTGAGKSILLGALGLLAGDKADASLISQGAETCVVEGEFDTPEGLRIIRRVLYSSGRSRSFIDDCPVQLQELTELGARLFDIHSQHQSLLLTDRQFQLSLLDNYAGSTGLAAQCRSEWDSLTRCRSRLQAARQNLARSNAEADYNSAQYDELQAAALRDGELEELEEEQLALGNAEEILERLGTARDLMYGASGTPINDLLQQARKSLEHAGKFLPDVQELAARIDSARIELDDILSEIDSAAGRIDASPRRLEQVEQRLGLLYRLMTKHGCNSVAGLIEARERFGKAVEGTSDLQEECSELESEEMRLEKSHSAMCRELHGMRDKARKDFAGEVTGHLRYLEMERATFEVGLQETAPGPSGSDSVSFLFSADGLASTEVSKCASGGELSRIMLSLKALMARFKGMPTLIFDEIDAGVSGSVAAKMGQMICRMAQTMQVFSITHLPQVAAKGSAHYVVSKTYDPQSGRTSSGIARVEGAEREREIARLLSGESITAEALANARALMEE
ncbi:MAG: DNA repair protein RecN [Bacteroidales bacterium]|nr:DNA repair protein RecN [Bacteroidales bacterium]